MALVVAYLVSGCVAGLEDDHGQTAPMSMEATFTSQDGQVTIRLDGPKLIADRELRGRPAYELRELVRGPSNELEHIRSHHYDGRLLLVRDSARGAEVSWERQGLPDSWGLSVGFHLTPPVDHLHVGGVDFEVTSKDGVHEVELSQPPARQWPHPTTAWKYDLRESRIPVAIRTEGGQWWERTDLVVSRPLPPIDAWPTEWPLHQESYAGPLYPDAHRDHLGMNVTPGEVLEKLAQESERARRQLQDGCVTGMDFPFGSGSADYYVFQSIRLKFVFNIEGEGEHLRWLLNRDRTPVLGDSWEVPPPQVLPDRQICQDVRTMGSASIGRAVAIFENVFGEPTTSLRLVTRASVHDQDLGGALVAYGDPDGPMTFVPYVAIGRHTGWVLALNGPDAVHRIDSVLEHHLSVGPGPQ